MTAGRAARDELTEDQRLLLAAAGGRTIAECLDGTEQGLQRLFTSHTFSTLDPAVVELRPEWERRRGWFHVRRNAVRLDFRTPDHNRYDTSVFVTRKRLHAYALTLAPEMRTWLHRQRELTDRAVNALVWSALELPGNPYGLLAPTRPSGTAPDSSKTANVAGVAAAHEYEPAETIALRDKVGELRAAWRAGRPLTGGQLFGLPALDGDVWVDMAGAAVVTDLEPKTITSWLSRGRPAACPFPAPSKYLGRLYWPASVLLAWVTEYAPHRRTSEHDSPRKR
ncbi:MAG: hypothetical protein J2P17_03530 [Mycobacterium sp.]|nr:hypothetical protein [Mycobacterium sp.]